jgi:Protein of unknwon function (DUF3008)
MAHRRERSTMYINDFESSSKYRLQQVLHTLKAVYGTELKLDEHSEDDLVSLTQSSEIIKNSIVSESQFNTYNQNPEYTKHMLIMEAVRLYLTEIAPKRSKKTKVKENAIPANPAQSPAAQGSASKPQPGMVKIKKNNDEKTVPAAQLANLQKQGYSVVGDDQVNENGLDEDWGSSDWTPLLHGMDEYLAQHGTSPETITAAAEEQAEHYWEHMGYDSAEDAANRIINMWMTRKGFRSLLEPIEESHKMLKEARYDHDSYQASMARAELYRNTKYAMDMLRIIKPEDDIQPWIAAALTKAANYLDKIFHYLDYYTQFEPDQLGEDEDMDPDVEDMELGETTGSIARENLMLVVEYSTKLFNMIQPGDKLEGWVAMKLTTASDCLSSSKHYLDYVQFEKHASDHVMGMEGGMDESKGSRKAVKETVGTMLMKMMVMEDQDLDQAQTLLAAKALSDDLLTMAEKVAKMSVEDLMPLVDTMKEQFGPEAAEGYNGMMKQTLEALLNATTEAKDTSDNAITQLQSGGVPAAGSDIEAAGEPGAAPEVPEVPGEEGGEEGDALGGTPAAAGPEEEPLGRAKKEGRSMRGNPISEGRSTAVQVNEAYIRSAKDAVDLMSQLRVMGKEVERTRKYPADFANRVVNDLYDVMMWIENNVRESAGIAEAWGTEMKTAAKDKGKWDGWTLARLKAHRVKLMAKEERTAAEQKEVKQLDFAIRAKQKDKWGKVDEAKKAKPDFLDVDKDGNKKESFKKAVSDKKKKESGKIEEKAVSQAQQKAAGIALAAKKGKLPKSELKGASKEMANMSKKELEKFAGTKHKGLPKKVTETAESFIAKNRDNFANRYGDNAEEVLYSAAWKKFGDKSENYLKAEAMLESNQAMLAKLEAAFAAHKRQFNRMLSEGAVDDPLNLGYGLDGEVMMDQMNDLNGVIGKLKEMIRSEVRSGALGMIMSEQQKNTVAKLTDAKETTPYGVTYVDPAGQKQAKFFESAQLRDYWLKLNVAYLNEHRIVNPEHFDRQISKLNAKKG